MTNYADMTSLQFNEEERRLRVHLKDMFLSMKQAGERIDAFKPGFNPTRVCMNSDTKKDWITYRDARDAYRDLWKQYQSLYEYSLINNIEIEGLNDEIQK